MKKFIIVLLIAVLALSTLSACGQENRPAKSNGLISVVSREDGSGTRGAFIELFGIEEKSNGTRIDHTTKEAIVTNSTEIVLSNVANDPNAIGYISLGSLNDRVKALHINGVAPTAENIRNNQYEISRPFLIATSETPTEITQDFIDFILSTDGQEIVEETGYIRTNHTSEPYHGKGSKGKIVIAGSSSVSPVMEKLVEAYQTRNEHAQIELQTNDSTTGLQSVLDGTADIGMASRNLSDSESALTATAFALDGIVIIVNHANTIDSLQKEDVKNIFTGETTLW